MGESRHASGHRGSSLRHQLLRGSLLGLVLAPMVLIAALSVFGIGALLSGYRPVHVLGASMEPTLREGDAIWVKYLDPSEVRAGDVVTLNDPALGSISHRATSASPLPGGGYMIVTKGDGNRYAEQWEVDPGGKVGVAFVRIRYLGHVLGLGTTTPGKLLIFGTIIALGTALQIARRRRMARGIRH